MWGGGAPRAGPAWLAAVFTTTWEHLPSSPWSDWGCDWLCCCLSPRLGDAAPCLACLEKRKGILTPSAAPASFSAVLSSKPNRRFAGSVLLPGLWKGVPPASGWVWAREHLLPASKASFAAPCMGGGWGMLPWPNSVPPYSVMPPLSVPFLGSSVKEVARGKLEPGCGWASAEERGETLLCIRPPPSLALHLLFSGDGFVELV